MSQTTDSFKNLIFDSLFESSANNNCYAYDTSNPFFHRDVYPYLIHVYIYSQPSILKQSGSCSVRFFFSFLAQSITNNRDATVLPNPFMIAKITNLSFFHGNKKEKTNSHLNNDLDN